MLGLNQFVALAGEGIKSLFTVPECLVCKAKDEAYWQSHNNYLTRIHYLEELVKTEKAEKEAILFKFYQALRLTNPQEIMRAEKSSVPSEQIKLHGIQSPMKQRAQAEKESRAKYWAEKAKAVSELPEAVSSKTLEISEEQNV
jgi:hypothetical protein